MKISTKILSLLVATSVSLSALTCKTFADENTNTNFKTILETQIDNSNLSENDKTISKNRIENLNKYIKRNKNPLGKVKNKTYSFYLIELGKQSAIAAQKQMQQALNSSNNQSTSINISQTYPDLTLFGVWQYTDGGVNHYDINETVHKSNLPLTIITYQEGYGDITGIWIDNVPLSKVYLSNKEVVDSNYTINQCCFRGICLENEIRNLDNGIHFITIQCTGLNDIQSATFSFNLTD